jgi:hypothetical protein
MAVSPYVLKSYGRTAMRAKLLGISGLAASGVIATAFFVQSLSSSSAQTPARQLPQYTASGDLILGFAGLDAWYYWANGAAVLLVISLQKPDAMQARMASA